MAFGAVEIPRWSRKRPPRGGGGLGTVLVRRAVDLRRRSIDDAIVVVAAGWRSVVFDVPGGIIVPFRSDGICTNVPGDTIPTTYRIITTSLKRFLLILIRDDGQNVVTWRLRLFYYYH